MSASLTRRGRFRWEQRIKTDGRTLRLGPNIPRQLLRTKYTVDRAAKKKEREIGYILLGMKTEHRHTGRKDKHASSPGAQAE